MMKKIIAVLMILVVLASATNVLADGLWYEYGCWWCIDNNGALHSLESRPLIWDTYMTNYHFPQSVVRDVSSLCSQYNGVPVGSLGITSNAGSNLRSYPTVDGNLSYDCSGRQDYKHSSILRKIHVNTTVYVYFSFYDRSGDLWYYATCSDGLSGFLLAKRIMLVPMG